MKKIFLIAISLFVSLSVAGQVEVSNIDIKQNGNKAEITFDAKVDKNATRRDYKLIMTPVLFSGSQSKNLPPIIVESARTRIVDARNRELPPANALLTENGRTERYSAVVDYQNWFPGSEIRFDRVKIGCCTEETLPPVVASTRFATGAPTPIPTPEPVPVPTAVVRSSGVIMILEKSAVAPVQFAQVEPSAPTTFTRLNIIFEKNDARINPFLFDNYRQLRDAVAALNANQGNLSGKIDITGFASPEGTEVGNFKLAHNRAIAVRNYLLDNVPHLRLSDFEIINGWENWEELYKMVEESRMPGRWQVLDIIERTPPQVDFAHRMSRKQMLMNLDGGRPWRYMYTNFFPYLRCATHITYKTVVDGGARYETPVNTASQHANTTEKINRAIDLTGERNTADALAILTQIENDPRAWNPMGVCFLLEGNIAKAKEYFQKAADAGFAEARGNLEQIN